VRVPVLVVATPRDVTLALQIAVVVALKEQPTSKVLDCVLVNKDLWVFKRGWTYMILDSEKMKCPVDGPWVIEKGVGTLHVVSKTTGHAMEKVVAVASWKT
jgi:23S rRNA C2498 (ribose-2'-O)-methylase RlmM